MSQPTQINQLFNFESHKDHQLDDLLYQPDYFHDELNAGEDSLEWQEFAQSQQPGNAG